MSRWLPWLAELQPEMFVEISTELAKEKGIANLEMVRISTPRNTITARALVTGRLRPFMINGQRVHQVGLPFHWGYKGYSTGGIANSLTSMVLDPNVSMHTNALLSCIQTFGAPTLGRPDISRFG